MLSTVVLPAPFGPIRLVTLPGSAENETPVAAFTPPNAIVRPSTSSGEALAGRAGSASRSGRGGTETRRLFRNRAISPTTPSGAIHSTTSNSAPKKSSRYSASPASSSGSRTTTAAPASGPVTVPAPPIMTTRTKRIDWENVNVDGVTKAESGAKSAPASPAQAADTVNATVFTATGLRPTDSAAVSESLTARIAAPQLDLERRQNASSTTAATTIVASATPRSPNDWPKIAGDGIPMIPFCPPVTPRHSTATYSTMKPNAIVTIAR